MASVPVVSSCLSLVPAGSAVSLRFTLLGGARLYAFQLSALHDHEPRTRAAGAGGAAAAAAVAAAASGQRWRSAVAIGSAAETLHVAEAFVKAAGLTWGVYGTENCIETFTDSTGFS